MAKPQLDYIEREFGGRIDASVIWLHGLGADGHDFEPVVPALELDPGTSIRFIFPHAPQRPITLNGGMVMRGWYDITGLEFVQQEDTKGIHESAAQVTELIEQEISRGIAAQRIVLAGFSQGGALALHTGLRCPHSLAGIVALSCYLPLADSLADQASPANQAIPIFMAHGLYDPLVPLALAESSREQLNRLGYRTDWRTYPVQHGIDSSEIRDIGLWLGDRL